MNIFLKNYYNHLLKLEYNHILIVIPIYSFGLPIHILNLLKILNKSKY